MSQATREEAIRDALEEINNLQHYIEVLNELPDLPSSATVFISHYGRVYINIPYNLGIYRPLRQQLAAVNWQAYSIINADNGDRYTEMRRNGDVLSVVMRPDVQGATCQLIKVGEKTEPVYRVQCGNGGGSSR